MTTHACGIPEAAGGILGGDRRAGVECELRTYIPEPQRDTRRWTDKPPEQEHAFRDNRRRTSGARSKRLQRQRSERAERSFAHVCETGGARRTWLRGLEKVNKRYKIQTAARNLGLIMLRLFGVGKPRALQGAPAFRARWATFFALAALPKRFTHFLRWSETDLGRQSLPAAPMATAALAF
jgi:hypothetical protein